MLRRYTSEPQPEWLDPPAWPSLRWWTSPIIDSMKLVIEARGHQGLRRKLNAISLFSGTLAEAWSSAALGLPIADFITCDVDESTRHFVKRFHGPRISHSFGDVGCFRPRAIAGQCTAHGRYCVVQEGLNDIDLLVGGPPCPPYSQMRHNRNSVPPEERLEFPTIFGCPETGTIGYLDVVSSYLPRGGEPFRKPVA